MTTKRIKTVVYLEPKDREQLEKLSEKTGATLSVLISRAVRAYLVKESK